MQEVEFRVMYKPEYNFFKPGEDCPVEMMLPQTR